MSLVTKFDHVAIAVEDLPRAVCLFQDVLGFQFVGGGDNPELQVRAIQLRLPPNVRVELITPTTRNSYLQRYLDRHGEGFHHITMYTDDVVSIAATLDAAGFETVDTTVDRDSWHETFLRPGSAFGILAQFSRAAVPWTEPLADVAVDDILAGRVEVLANVVRWKQSRETILPLATRDAD